MRDALRESLDSIPDIRAYTDLGMVINPPAAIVGPPTLTWGGFQSEPTEARFTVALVVAGEGAAIPRLFALLSDVVVAIDSVSNAVVRTAEPGTYPAGGTDLPAYLIEVECAL